MLVAVPHGMPLDELTSLENLAAWISRPSAWMTFFVIIRLLAAPCLLASSRDERVDVNSNVPSGPQVGLIEL